MYCNCTQKKLYRINYMYTFQNVNKKPLNNAIYYLINAEQLDQCIGRPMCCQIWIIVFFT